MLVFVSTQCDSPRGCSFAGPADSAPVVVSVDPAGLAASSTLRPGMELHAVNDELVGARRFEDCLALVQAASFDAVTPLALTFTNSGGGGGGGAPPVAPKKQSGTGGRLLNSPLQAPYTLLRGRGTWPGSVDWSTLAATSPAVTRRAGGVPHFAVRRVTEGQIPIGRVRLIAKSDTVALFWLVGRTPLMVGAVHGHRLCWRLLIERTGRAGLDLQDDDGRTALLHAAAAGDAACARDLLTAGCNADAQNAIGETASDIAEAGGHDAVLRALLSPSDPADDEASEGASALSQRLVEYNTQNMRLRSELETAAESQRQLR